MPAISLERAVTVVELGLSTTLTARSGLTASLSMSPSAVADCWHLQGSLHMAAFLAHASGQPPR